MKGGIYSPEMYLKIRIEFSLHKILKSLFSIAEKAIWHNNEKAIWKNTENTIWKGSEKAIWNCSKG